VQLSSVGGGTAGFVDGVDDGFDARDVETTRGEFSSSVVLVDGSAVEACSER
jgi:hypothetical protein